MTNPIVRLAPSGPPILNTGGGPLSFGPGARLRLAEAVSTMSGSLAVPAAADVIAPDGFGQTDAIVLTLDAPKEALSYRANLTLDLQNTSTDSEGQVVLYLDVSVDGGATYTNRAKNVHLLGPVHPSLTEGVEARQAEVAMPLILGSALGVSDAVPTPSIKLRARASLPLGAAGLVRVSSLDTSAGTTPVTGLNGTIHLELSECF